MIVKVCFDNVVCFLCSYYLTVLNIIVICPYNSRFELCAYSSSVILPVMVYFTWIIDWLIHNAERHFR